MVVGDQTPAAAGQTQTELPHEEGEDVNAEPFSFMGLSKVQRAGGATNKAAKNSFNKVNYNA